MEMKKINWFKLLVSVVGTFLAGAAGALIGGKMSYDTVILPPYSPPSWAFPVAWNILYLLAGISLYLVWCTLAESDAEKRTKKTAVILYIVIMALNIIWPLLFALLSMYLVAFIAVLVMAVATCFLVFLAFKINKISAYLLIPYVVWLVYAAYISFGVYLGN